MLLFCYVWRRRWCVLVGVISSSSTLSQRVKETLTHSIHSFINKNRRRLLPFFSILSSLALSLFLIAFLSSCFRLLPSIHLLPLSFIHNIFVKGGAAVKDNNNNDNESKKEKRKNLDGGSSAQKIDSYSSSFLHTRTTRRSKYAQLGRVFVGRGESKNG